MSHKRTGLPSAPRATPQCKRGGSFFVRSSGARGTYPMGTFSLRMHKFWRHDSVTAQVIRLAWPVVIEQMLGTAVGLVNMFIVGHLGADAIAAVGLSNQIRMLLMALFSAVGVGATAVIARQIGAGKPREASAMAGQALGLAVIVGFIASVPCILMGGTILRALGGGEKVITLGTSYLIATGTSMPLMAILFIGNAALRGAGDTRTPMLVMVLVNVVNGLLTWILVRGLGPLPGLGFLGAGIAAGTGMGLGGLTVAWALFSGYSTAHLHVRARDLRFRWHRIWRLLDIGLPTAAEQIFLRVGQLLLAGIVTQLGTAAYAGHQLAIQLLSVGFMPGFAFSVAATTLVGQELGRKAPRRAAACVYTSLWMALAVMGLAGIAGFAFARPLLQIFSTDQEVLTQGYYAMQGCVVMQLPLAMYFVFSGALRGAGDTRFVLVAQAVPIWLVRLTLAPRLGIALGFGLTGIWAAMVLDVIARAAMVALRFRSGKWTTLKV